MLGYFEHDEAAHLLLDIGFVWTVFLDGEMGLVPQKMAIAELDLGEEAKAELGADARALGDVGGDGAGGLFRVTPAPAGCLVTDVSFYSRGDRRRRLVTGEEASLMIESSLVTGEIRVSPVEHESNLA